MAITQELEKTELIIQNKHGYYAIAKGMGWGEAHEQLWPSPCKCAPAVTGLDGGGSGGMVSALYTHTKENQNMVWKWGAWLRDQKPLNKGDFGVGGEVGWAREAECRVDPAQRVGLNNWCFILQETERELCS